MSRAWVQPLLVILCISLLFVRASGMHMHLCLDGQESPAQIHLGDAGVHDDEEHAGLTHEDRDVELSDALAKTFKGVGELGLVALVLFALAILLLRDVGPLPSRVQFRVLRVPFLLPPSRGPPQIASLNLL